MTANLEDDVAIAKRTLAALPRNWEGKQCIRELKAADYNWRQMEWWGFYFEHLCRTFLKNIFTIPGDKYGKTQFDAKRTTNWDFKAKAIKSDDHRAILNDVAAMDNSIKDYGAHGLIIAMCDVEYNDEDRSFQRWHEQLKGGKSKYQLEREKRTSASRYRKTHATLQEILFLAINRRNVNALGIHHQGRNSNGKPRPPKYMLDFDAVEAFIVDSIEFTS